MDQSELLSWYVLRNLAYDIDSKFCWVNFGLVIGNSFGRVTSHVTRNFTYGWVILEKVRHGTEEIFEEYRVVEAVRAKNEVNLSFETVKLSGKAAPAQSNNLNTAQ